MTSPRHIVVGSQRLAPRRKPLTNSHVLAVDTVSIGARPISIPAREVRRVGPKGACRSGGHHDQPIANHDQPIANQDQPGGNGNQLREAGKECQLLSPRRSWLSAAGSFAKMHVSDVDLDWASADLNLRTRIRECWMGITDSGSSFYCTVRGCRLWRNSLNLQPFRHEGFHV